MNNIKGVLFDLDGTLVDTSVDMCNCLNTILERRKLKKVECADLKYHISRGAIGIIQFASDVNGRSIDSSLIRAEFLEEYHDNCFVKTKLVLGMSILLEHLNQKKIPWGVVTNKHYKFANKIIKGLQLEDKISCFITGNMVENPKPSPDMLIKATSIIRQNPKNIIYVGDDERDIIAGKAAGMKTAIANFGFITETNNCDRWGADYFLNKPQDLLDKI